MELLQLTYFCDAAVTQNFSKTAQKYNVPPSNISQSIKRLEIENMPLTVAVDCHGGNAYQDGMAAYMASLEA